MEFISDTDFRVGKDNILIDLVWMLGQINMRSNGRNVHTLQNVYSKINNAYFLLCTRGSNYMTEDRYLELYNQFLSAL